MAVEPLPGHPRPGVYPQPLGCHPAGAIWLEKYWEQPENGIWKIRERKDHWLYGKILCYAGLTAASHLSIEIGRLQWAGRWHR
jgi:GH15 family glucan-1,4-alpha-glucosidase